MLLLSITLVKICKPLLKIKPHVFESGFAFSQFAIQSFPRSGSSVTFHTGPLHPCYNPLLSLQVGWLPRSFKFFFKLE